MRQQDRRILVCDDDKDILDVTGMLLAIAGFEVTTQNDSTLLLAQAVSEQPNLLLIDLWMPLLPGDKLITIIKSTPEVKHIPVILFSAAIDGQLIAKEAGADRFIEKPFDVDNLAMLINDVLDSHNDLKS